MRAALLLLAMAACSSRSTTVSPAPAPAAKLPASTAPSVYELGITLRDSADQRIGLDALRGGPVLLTMFYASCAVACPAVIEDLRRTLAEAPPDVKVLLVSFDPARDTPAKLAELAAARGLDGRWTLAAADDADVRELAAAIGYRYRKLETGEFFHGSTIVLLDAEGRPLARTEGFNQREPLLEALR